MPTLRARIVEVGPPNENGWVRITTDGRPAALQTQREEKIEQARGFRDSGEQLDIVYDEVESRNINPHTQKPYLNRYYDTATVVANGASAPRAASGDGGDPGFGYRTWPDDAWRISLSVGTERAIQLAALEEPRDLSFDRLWLMAYGFAFKIYTTPKPDAGTLAEAIPFGETPSGQSDGPPPYIDDDWPPRE